jgi:hypothetical protein
VANTYVPFGLRTAASTLPMNRAKRDRDVDLKVEEADAPHTFS